MARLAAAAATPCAPPLPSPYPELGVPLSAAELRVTAYELLVAASRATAAKPLTYIPQSVSAASGTSSPSLKRPVTSRETGKVKGAATELVRVRMGVTELLGRRAESMVLPLEFLQKLKESDFPDPLEYEAWQTRNFKLLEAGLLIHPLVPLKKSDSSAQRLHQIIHEGYDGQLEPGRNSEPMQRLRSAVLSLACRSLNETSDECHWVDGFPLNLHIYKMLVEACFNAENGTVADEIDEVMELLKKTWVILGVNQMLHNLCFTWSSFNHFVMLGQADNEFLSATETMLLEVAKDAKITKDPDYCDVLSSTINSIMGWTEKRLLAYHETFDIRNIDSMEDIVSIGITSAKILVEDISDKCHSGTKEVTDVVRSRIETYIRSSLRAAFAQKMANADSKRSSMNHMPVLSILAKEVSNLAIKENNVYTPILEKWHPLAAVVAVATLHDCFGNELKQFVVGLTKLTPDAVQVLKASDTLEKDLVQIALEYSVDSDDGGKSLARDMPPYEAGTVISNLVKAWVDERVDKLKGCADQNLQQETWSPKASSRDSLAPSAVEMLDIVDETLGAYFQLPIPHSTLLPDLTGTRRAPFPQLPHLTRCDVGSKLFKKKEKPQLLVKRVSQVGSSTGNEASCLAGLCIRINTIHYIHNELEYLDRKIKTCLQNVESDLPDIAHGLNIKFELSQPACQEGIQQLCEATAYKVIFNDLGHVLLDTLYVGSPASNRILPLLRELGPILKIISATVHDGVRNHLITALMKASFDGFLLVLLAGGPTRAFRCQDYQMIEDDFRALRGLYLAYCDGLPGGIVAKTSSEVKSILPLLRMDTETLIERFKQMISESYGSTTKSRFPMPPVPTKWSPNNPNTNLRVLCYRNDEAATKFLKKTYNLPKTL
ncbi:hypothetical protein ACP70R_015668 [Stipagrostis hirtigluma subsp. patula]